MLYQQYPNEVRGQITNRKYMPKLFDYDISDRPAMIPIPDKERGWIAPQWMADVGKVIDMYGGEAAMNPEDVTRSAMTLMTGGKSGPKGSLGIFGGKASRTADLKALAKAEEMLAKGVDRDTIWKETGWGKNRKGQWFYEIPDVKAKLKPTAAEEEVEIFKKAKGKNLLDLDTFDELKHLERKSRLNALRPRTIESAMEHPELYEAYPTLKTYSTREFPRKGYYRPATREFAYRPDPAGKENILLHEIQHAVQDIEGFPRGANTKSPEYWRTPGEVEARNVQLRQKLSPDERRLFTPWSTEDEVKSAKELRTFLQKFTFTKKD